MRDEYSLNLKIDPNEDDVDRLRIRLAEYNNAHVPTAKWTRLLLTIDDDAGKLSAGLYARMHLSWMFVDLLWVAEPIRGLGLGADLLVAAERTALQQGCHSVWLDTFSFQAPDFYRKQGYEVFGELANYPSEHRRFFFCKKLS